MHTFKKGNERKVKQEEKKERKEGRKDDGTKSRECREVRYRPAKEEVETGSREEEERKWIVQLSQNIQEEITHTSTST